MDALPQEDVLIYQRAKTASREVLEQLEQITEPHNPLHEQALALSGRLETVLVDLLRGPAEVDPSPPAMR
ncbi:MAG: hypothetical protein LC797_07230 [Chloroflexi bacterium]|nr:hypothetical protein [Chloroflexota bacterium]